MSSTVPAPALAAIFTLISLAGPASWALAQDHAPAPIAQTSRATTAPKVAQAVPKPAPAVTKPGWSELSTAEKSALSPLSSAWATMSEAQKRKWQALSKNYASLPATEKAKLHSRMAEWVALSPQQRAQARLNFGETKALAPDDKKAKWEAYQALSAEEKRKLAADAGAKTPSTAAAVKPVPARKLANVPKPGPDAKTPRIAAGPAHEAAGSAPHSSPSTAPAQPH
jgi:hypothetical protein